MRPEHDPQVLAARAHLRPHLVKVLAEACSDPERAADLFLDRGDVYSDETVEIRDVEGRPTPMRVRRAVLAIRNPWPSQYDLVETVAR